METKGKSKNTVDTQDLEDGNFWVVVERDQKAGKDGLAVTAISDKEYSELMSDFDVERIGAEILMAHRC